MKNEKLIKSILESDFKSFQECLTECLKANYSELVESLKVESIQSVGFEMQESKKCVKESDSGEPSGEPSSEPSGDNGSGEPDNGGDSGSGSGSGSGENAVIVEKDKKYIKESDSGEPDNGSGEPSGDKEPCKKADKEPKEPVDSGSGSGDPE